MRTGESGAVRKSAADSLLDRGYGKPQQSHAVELSANDRLLNLIEQGLTRAAR